MTNLGRESETVGFEGSLSRTDAGVKTLAAMLNRHHTGTVYFGVDGRGDVIGTDADDAALQRIRNAVRNDIVPPVVPEIAMRISDDGRWYVSVRVTGYSVPYSYREKYYIRTAASDESAGPEAVVRLVMTRRPDPLREIRSDEQDLTFGDLFGRLVSRGMLPRNDAECFRSWGMLDQDGGFNLNAYLLSDQNTVPMQIVEFSGTDRSSASNRTDYGGCSLVRSMEDISERISMIMEVKTEGVSDKQDRVDVPLFDFDAFREAWVNACVHNAWWSMVPPSVMLFDDRIEVVSCGPVPFPMSDEAFFTRSSRPMNPGLFTIFAAMGKIEQSGHGVPRIARSYGRGAFSTTQTMTIVTIPYAFGPRWVEVREADRAALSDIDPESRAVLHHLRDHPQARLQDLSDRTGASLSTVKKRVSSLKSRGLLVNEGTNRRSAWSVKSPAVDPVHRD